MDQLDARGVAEEDLAVGRQDLAVLRIRVEHAPVEIERAAPAARAELGGGQVRGDPGVPRLLAGQHVEAAARLGGSAPGQVEPGLQPAQPRRRGIVGQVAIHDGARLLELRRVHEQLRVVFAERAVARVALEQRAIGRERLLEHAQARQDARPHHLGLERVRGLRRPGAAGGVWARATRDRGAQGQAQEPGDGAGEAEGGHRGSMAAASAAFKGGAGQRGRAGRSRSARSNSRRARSSSGRPRRARPGGSAPRSRRPSRG